MIRGGLVTLLTIVLFITLLCSAGFLTITMSLNFNAVKPKIVSTVDDIIRNQTDVAEQIDNDLVDMQIHCQNNTEFVREYTGYVFEIPCETISQGTEEIVKYTVNDLVERVYYQDYDCKLRDCFSQEENVFFLFSKHSQNYWRGWFWKSLIISILLVVGLFFLMMDRFSLPFLVGIITIIVSLPFLGFGKLLGLVTGWEYAMVLALFFTKAYTTFVIYFVAGIVLIGIGLVLKFLSAGRFIGKALGMEDRAKKAKIKEEVKAEIKEEAKVEPKPKPKPKKKK